jgi:hypothetical protein
MDDLHTVTVKSLIISADVSRLGFQLRYEAQKNFAYVMVPLQSQPAKCGMLRRAGGKSA